MLRNSIPTSELVEEWASVEKMFRCGRQGITGVLKTRTSPSKYIVFKLSQNIDYLVEHEYKVMSRLNDIAHFCPHFCLAHDYIMCAVEPRLKKYKNPFDIMSKNPIYKAVLLEEFIRGTKLGSHIDNQSDQSMIFSAIKQVILAIAIAQKKTRFTHYDLHTDNVILNRCDPNTVFLYVMDQSTSYMVPSNGYQAKIIDYGFSYVDSVDGEKLTTSLFHTDIGYTNDRFDWLTDAKLFLISIAYQLKNSFPNSKMVRKFKNCVRNMFSNLAVEWEYGWDDNEGDSVADELLEECERDYRDYSFLFNKHKIDAIGVLQSIITVPFHPYDTRDLSLSYSTFLKEFSKIENQVENTVHLFYILKAILDCAKKIKDDYLSDETRKMAVTKFKEYIVNVIDSVAKFCTIKGLNYEKMLCALYSFEECASGFLYKKMKQKYKEKTFFYDSLPVKDILKIANVVYFNCEDKYDFSTETKIRVNDSVLERSVEFKLTQEEIDKVNDVDYWMKAPTILQMYKNRCKLEETEQSDCEMTSSEDGY